MTHEQFKALYHFLNGRDTFACLPTGHGKTLVYQIAVLVARTGKSKNSAIERTCFGCFTIKRTHI